MTARSEPHTGSSPGDGMSPCRMATTELTESTRR